MSFFEWLKETDTFTRTTMGCIVASLASGGGVTIAGIDISIENAAWYLPAAFFCFALISFVLGVFYRLRIKELDAALRRDMASAGDVAGSDETQIRP